MIHIRKGSHGILAPNLQTKFMSPADPICSCGEHRFVLHTVARTSTRATIMPGDLICTINDDQIAQGSVS